MFVIIETLWNCASCHEYMPPLCCYQKPYCHRIPCKNIYFFELSESEKEIVVIL